MADFIPQKGGEEPGYEKRDTNPAALARVMGMVLGGTVLVVMLSALLFYWLLKLQPVPWTPEAAIVQGRRDFPEPRLQVNPPVDMDRLRQQFGKETTEYGWADQSKGEVRLPVERAMDLVLERGLPATERKVTPLEMRRERAKQPSGS